MEDYKNRMLSDIQGEVWVEIPASNGYLASNKGRIKSPKRIVRTGKGAHRSVDSKIVSQYKSKDGYLRVSLRIDARGKKFTTHRLIASAFHKNPEQKPTVNHINSNRSDNRPENLEWSTYSENNKHGYAVGRHMPPTPMKGMFGEDHHLSCKVRCPTFGVVYGSLREASRHIGYTATYISSLLKSGKPSKHGVVFTK